MSEETGRWPALGGWTFDPFELDAEIPSGTYRIYFVSTQTSGIPLPTTDGRPSPDVQWENPKAPAGTAAVDAALEAAELAPLDGQPDPAACAAQKAELKVNTKTDDPAFRRHLREVEQERFARDIADSRLLLGQKMRHAGESAELLVVLRGYRSELEKAARMPIALAMEYMEAAKRSHTEYNVIFGDMLKKNGELAKQLAEAQKAQPPPPPPSLLAQIVTPETVSFAKVIAEIVNGRGRDSDTVTATAEDPELKRLRKKRDEAKAKLRRLQLAAKKGAEPEEEARSEQRGTRSAKKQAGSEKAGTQSAHKPQDKKNRKKARKQTPQKNPTKPGRSRAQ